MKYLLIIITVLFTTSVNALNIIMPEAIFTPTQAKNGMIVSGEKIATEIGLQVLKDGGNAIDAAVTIGFVLSVTFPQAGNIGGGGFMLIYSAKDQQVVAIDYREKAPAKASKDMFLNQQGEVDYKLSQFSYLSAGVPGTVAGMAMALEKYGTSKNIEKLYQSKRFLYRDRCQCSCLCRV